MISYRVKHAILAFLFPSVWTAIGFAKDKETMILLVRGCRASWNVTGVGAGLTEEEAINDICYLSDLLDVILFADEINMFFCGLFVPTTLLHSCVSSTCPINLKRIAFLQKRVVWIVNNTDPIFAELTLLSVDQICFLQVASFMVRFENNSIS